MAKNGYAREVYRRFLKAIKMALGRYWLFWVVANIVGFIFYYAFLVRVDNLNALENLRNDLILLISINLAFVLFSTPYLRFWIIPEEIYNEQKTKLAYYNRKTLKLESKDYGGVQSRKERGEVVALSVFKNMETMKILEMEISLVHVGFCKDHNGRVNENPIFTDLGNVLWENGSHIITVAPENEAKVYFAMTDRNLNTVILATSSIAKIHFDEMVFNITMRLKGKLEGDSEYHFYTHNILLYWRPEINSRERKLAILDERFNDSDISPALLSLRHDMASSQ